MEVILKVIKPFRDKRHGNALRRPNKELHEEKERAEELIQKGYAVEIEIEKKPEQPPEKKTIEIETATVEPEAEKAVPEKKKTTSKKKKKEE